jgi:hypothetical protein
MTSIFMIGATVDGLTGVDALATPCPIPQPQFNQFRKMLRLGDLTMKGSGPQTVIWGFPLIETEQLAMLETFKSASPIYIQTTRRDDSVAIFEVLMNWIDPKQDGDHQNGLYGYRSGLVLEFIVLSEVAGS